MLVLSFTALALLLRAISAVPYPGPRSEYQTVLPGPSIGQSDQGDAQLDNRHSCPETAVLPRQDPQQEQQNENTPLTKQQQNQTTPLTGCFRGNDYPSIDDMTIDTRGTRGPGKYNAYLIMNSINKAVLASQPERIFDLVDPTTCQPQLLTGFTYDEDLKALGRDNAWFITAAMSAEKDFANQTAGGTLKRGWELITDKPVDYLRLDGCQPEVVQSMANLLARVPGYPLTAQWDPTRAPEVTYRPPPPSLGAYAMTYGTIIGANNHTFGFVPGDQKYQIQIDLAQVCDAGFEVWGPSCIEPVGEGGQAADACFGPRVQRW